MALTLSRAGRWALALIAGAAALRLVIAAFLPLGVDEAYAVAVARGFSLSFQDHPPLGFWLPVAMAGLTGVEHPLVYRLPAVTLGALTAWAIWRMGTHIGGARAGLWGLALFLVAPHMALGSGLLVVPDAPLNAAGALFALAVLAIIRAGPSAPLSLWIAAGAAAAVAAASKYNAIFLPVGLLGFLLTEPGWRRVILAPGPWLCAAVSALGALPVLLWNYEHGWPSFAFHGARSAVATEPLNLVAMTAAQALYLLPPVIVLACAGLWWAVRGARAQPVSCAPDAQARLLAWLALPQIAAFSLLYLLGGETFPHWTMPGWLFALPLAGAWIAARGPLGRRRARNWAAGFAVPVWVLLAAAVLHVNTGVLTRGFETPPAWDDTTGLFPWQRLAPELERAGWLDGTAFLAAESWAEAGLMSAALGGRYSVRVLGTDARHFAHGPGAAMTGDALLLVPGLARDAAGDLPRRVAVASAAAADGGAEVTGEGAMVIMPRGGHPYAAVAVLRLHWPAPESTEGNPGAEEDAM